VKGLWESDCCFFCPRPATEAHHVFSGAYRKKSERHRYKVGLCHWCHNEPPDGVHFNHENSLVLKRMAQAEFEKTHTREEFIQVFGKSYAEGEEE
jgi:hypothetical protein